MKDKIQLLDELHALRVKLQHLAEARGSLTDPDVLAASEAADELIVDLQRIQKEELTRGRASYRPFPSE
ncbi:aspartyl-phosphate phosphatase Spo0E family protein [Paenibacillus methanolicus]|uniref:Spo0E like sporulation regulatory protein n=1 Tax=Paenibacillus methanolicus TaxID=582686 RepID=A0A5S5BQS9_9BACL|nr:aspartyl-phosphate phosphatase Spo0E family protein [Paenibacillus methanolicus]TYP69357.1 Spo0E like sporulation regulatory protein [Paenibacillus methanolicus]